MNRSSLTGRTFMTIASAATTAVFLHAEPDTTSAVASQFLASWEKAWNNHDAVALGELHTLDAVTVNRFVTLIVARASTEKALGFLHSKESPFGHSKFPAPKLIEVRRTLLRITKDHADAEDALQEAPMKAFLHIDSFDGRSTFTTWLTRIAINSVLMAIHKRGRWSEASLQFQNDDETFRTLEITDKRLDPASCLAINERWTHIEHAISTLTPGLRKVMEAHLLLDGTLATTARTTGLTLAATKSCLIRARAQLKKTLCRKRQL